jgi:hypothetical protein
MDNRDRIPWPLVVMMAIAAILSFVLAPRS